MIDYTTVIGIDAVHARQLEVSAASWQRHKPSIFARPVVAFYDAGELSYPDAVAVVGRFWDDRRLVPWPPPGVVYEGDPSSKFTKPQRCKMLAGFVHVSARFVETPYWLKLDTDTVATGEDDWIDPEWFRDDPGIVSHPWGFTKPADQMVKLDEWSERFNLPVAWSLNPPLNLHPKPGWSRVRHKRIISWCGFFGTELSRICSIAANMTVGPGQLPVPSQDGFMWYAAKRVGMPIVRANMKSRGWRHLSSMSGIKKAVEEALA